MPDHAVSVIPAEKGYFALDRLVDHVDHEKMSLTKLPVIGWVVRVYDGDNDTYLEPVTVEALSSHYHNEVLHPDGRVVQFGLQQWDDLKQFESYARHLFENTLDNQKLLKGRHGIVERV